MKLMVFSTVDERVTSMTKRTFDGTCRISEYHCGVNIYADTDNVLLKTAIEIKKFIQAHIKTGEDQVYDWSYNGGLKETFNPDFTSDLLSILDDPKFISSENKNECPFLLNVIIPNIYESHKKMIKLLEEKQKEIKKEYENKALKSKMEIAQNTFMQHPYNYELDEKMPGINEFPLDIARLNDNVQFLEFLLNKNATKVSNSYSFRKWLCKKGKFEYLPDFFDRDINIYDKDYILYYALYYNRLDIFKKYSLDEFGYKITEVDIGESILLNSKSWLSIGQIAAKYSNLEIVKELSDEYDFYINMSEKGIHTSNKSNQGNKKRVLDINCFRDNETSLFFINKYTSDSIYAMFYWNKTEFLNEVIKSEKFDLSNIDLSSLSDFFIPDNNSILYKLASLNLLSFINKPTIENINNNFRHIKNNPWKTYYSVLDKCVDNKNFDLMKLLFELSTKKEDVNSYASCQLLFKICIYEKNNEAMELKNLVFRYINKEDIMPLAGIACIEDNVNLLRFLINHITNINEPVEIEHSFFGDDTHNIINKKIREIYNKGTLLHLLIAFTKMTSIRGLNIELIHVLINAGINISNKDAIGKTALEYINNSYKNEYDFDGKIISKRNELVKLLYTNNINICNEKGELNSLFQNVDLPIVKKYKEYFLNGLSPFKAFVNNNKEAIDFFISCGAEYQALKSHVEFTIRKKEGNMNNYDTSDTESTYSQDELRGMYRNAFDGFDDAPWNVD